MVSTLSVFVNLLKEPQEQIFYLLMIKEEYIAPTIEVIDIVLEKGFAASTSDFQDGGVF